MHRLLQQNRPKANVLATEADMPSWAAHVCKWTHCGHRNAVLHPRSCGEQSLLHAGFASYPIKSWPLFGFAAVGFVFRPRKHFFFPS
jgi:hypothetical protein